MTIQRTKNLLSGGVGVLMIIALGMNVPDTASLDMAVWLFYAGLVALMLNLGTMFNEGIVSPASTAALMAYLTLGEDGTVDGALWCVTVGALVGNLVWLLRTVPTTQSRRQYTRVIRGILVGMAQMTLSLIVGDWVYRLFGGTLPLEWLDHADVIPLIALVISYLATYLGILFLDVYIVWQKLPRAVLKTWQGSIEAILLPLPFGVVGALAYHNLSQLAFLILIGGLLIIVTGVNLFSRTQARFQQQVDELSALSVVSRAMRANLDLTALLDLVYEQTTHLLHVGNFTIALFDANRNMLYFPLNVRDHTPTPLEPSAFGKGLIEYVIEQKEPLLIPNQVPRRAGLMSRTPPLMPVYSWIGVPLLAADRVLGCMVVYSSATDRHFRRNDLQLLTTIAAQVGIAVDNAQLYKQAQDRVVQLATLNNVSTILSGTLDVEQILDMVGSSAVAISGCQAVALYMWWNAAHQALTLTRRTGLSEHFADDAPRPLLLDIDDLQRRRQPLLVSDSHIDQRVQTGLLKTMDREYKRAWAEFLLRKGDELAGIIVFYYNDPRDFDKEEIELLRNFVNQAALAISNARLYTQTDEALNRRIDQLSALAEISRELASTLELEGLFQLVLDRAIEATQSQTGALWLRPASGEKAPSLVAWRGFSPIEALNQITPLVGPIAQTYQTGYPTLIPDVHQDDRLSLPDVTTRAQLNVPIMRGETVLGVISLGSERAHGYGQEDMLFVRQLATQAQIAINNARLFSDIEEARDRLQLILDSMREGVILISAPGRIALANPRVERMLGLSPQHIMSAPLGTLLKNPALHVAERLGFQPETLLHLIKNLDQGRWEESSRDGNRITFQIAAPKRRFIDRANAPVRDEQGRVIGLLMVFVDVTDQHELAQAREDLGNMIVHDLRGPLTAITTSLKLLNEFVSPEDRMGVVVKQTTETSLRAVRKLLNLVDSLLDISKLESGVIDLDCEPSALRPMGDSALDELAPLAQQLNVTLTNTIPASFPLLNVDASKVERVLLNLVDNALKFTPADGYVSLTAHDPGTMGAEDHFVRIEVCDTGPGVPDQHKERLFDRFAQIDDQRGHRRGTGLGLTFCKLAVEAHGGQIWIEDNPQGGAIFAFTLPVFVDPES
ncbi:MAG: GAF domain-containing protein [Anaerolineae bacterium]|nr:GAF domain-containing protein [Anaerolineae bacterium]